MFSRAEGGGNRGATGNLLRWAGPWLALAGGGWRLGQGGVRWLRRRCSGQWAVWGWHPGRIHPPHQQGTNNPGWQALTPSWPSAPRSPARAPLVAHLGFLAHATVPCNEGAGGQGPVCLGGPLQKLPWLQPPASTSSLSPSALEAHEFLGAELSMVPPRRTGDTRHCPALQVGGGPRPAPDLFSGQASSLRQTPAQRHFWAREGKEVSEVWRLLHKHLGQAGRDPASGDLGPGALQGTQMSGTGPPSGDISSCTWVSYNRGWCGSCRPTGNVSNI